MAWSPDSTRLATASSFDREVRLWDPTNGNAVATLTSHAGGVYALAWSPDSTRLATASNEGKIYIFTPNRPDDPIYLQVEPLTSLQWARTGIAVGGSGGVSVLDLRPARVGR